MWALGVVVDAPAFDDDLGFLQAIEDLAVEAFIPEFAVEGFGNIGSPTASWFDVQACVPTPSQPLAKHLGHYPCEGDGARPAPRRILRSVLDRSRVRAQDQGA